mgnify:CR=1 FL=1
MKDKVKAIVLDGNLVSETYINKVVDEGLKDVCEILGIDKKKPRGLAGYSFGFVYRMYWQHNIEENTSMELTTKVGVSSPIFINSKVVITSQDVFAEDPFAKDPLKNVTFLDVKQDHVRKYFNTKDSFWALEKLMLGDDKDFDF